MQRSLRTYILIKVSVTCDNSTYNYSNSDDSVNRMLLESNEHKRILTALNKL